MPGGRVATRKEEAAGGQREQDAVPCAVQGAMGGGCAVQGAREVGGARRARSSEPTPAARSGERGAQLSGAPDTPGLIKVTAGTGGGGGQARGCCPSPHTSKHHPPPTSLTSGSSHLPPTLPSLPHAWTRVPRRGRGRGSPASTPDAPGMLRAPEPLTWGRDTRSTESLSRGAGRRARLLLVSASSSVSRGLRPGHGAARRGRAAATVPSAAAAAAAA